MQGQTWPTNLPNAWKLSFDHDKSGEVAPAYFQGSVEEKQTVIRKSPTFAYDFVTRGPSKVQCWDMENVTCVREFEKAEKYAGVWEHMGHDVLETQRKIVCGMKKSSGSDGNIIVVYDIDSGEAKELRKDEDERKWTGFCCLWAGGAQTAVAADADRKVRLFDVSNGRPGNSYQVQDWTLHMEGDHTNPNLFYVLNSDKIYVFDKNMKKEARVIIGMKKMQYMQIPAPGNQVIANSDNEVKIFDLGSGRVVHTLGGVKEYTGRCSMLANIAVATTGMDLQIWDLSEKADEPARELRQEYQHMHDVFVMPTRVLAMAHRIWLTTPFEA